MGKKPLEAKSKIVNEFVSQATYALIKGFTRQYVTQLRKEKKVEETIKYNKILVRDKQA